MLMVLLLVVMVLTVVLLLLHDCWLLQVMQGREARTTLMIRNIPNKYTQKMLLHEIDVHHIGM